MAGKVAQRSATRKAKYAAQFARTEANKKRHIAKMKKDNPNWPEKKDRKEKKE